MAHYAVIHNGIVVQVITGVDENMTQIDTDGTVVGGSTEAWEAFYAAQPWHAHCIVRRTSYNALTGGFRKNYAGIGFTWDEDRDAFIPPKPYPSWVLNETTCRWESPIPYPSDGQNYWWNENQQAWEKVVENS